MVAVDDLLGPIESAPAQPPAGGRPGPGRVFRQFLLVCASILALYPVWFMISTAFKSSDQYLENTYGFPWPLDGANFSDARSAASSSAGLRTARSSASARCSSQPRSERSRPSRSHAHALAADAFLSINVALLIVPPVVMLITSLP